MMVVNNNEVVTYYAVDGITINSSLQQTSTNCWQSEQHHQHTNNHHHNNNKQPAQVIILGDPKVGKTALLVRFLTRRFIGQYRNNTDMRYTHSVDSISNQPSALITTSYNNSFTLTHRRPLVVEFIDISHSPIEDHLDTSEASFVVVYNICERSSFLTAKRLVWMIRKLKVPNRVPVLLIGNKKDLAEAHRQVTEDEIEKLGQDCDVIALETSAASDCAGVTTAFNRLLTETRDFIDEQRRNNCSICGSENNDASPKRKSSLTILSSLTQIFANRRKRRKPHTL